MDRPNLEPSGSLVGLLQRGRGAGYLAALKGDLIEVNAALLACICADQSWTFGLYGGRDEYYASLGLATGLPLEPIRAFIRDSSAEQDMAAGVEMACHVLAEMAKRGSVEAAAVLIDEVREGPGWLWAIEVLSDVDFVLADTPELFQRELLVDEVLVDGLSDRLKTSGWVGDPPWAALNAYPQLRWLAPEMDFDAATGRGEVPDVSGLSVEELRAAASTYNPLYFEAARTLIGRLSLEELRAEALARRVRNPLALEAARTLGGLGDLDILDTVVAVLEADPGTPEIRYRKRFGDYLVALPAECSLPLARRWLDDRFPLSMVADEIFEARAEPVDRVVIERTVLASLDGGDYYRVWTLSGALKRLADRRSAPTMRTVFEECPYAIAREPALGGLIAIGNADADDLIFEALWDCYSGCRHLACVHAPLSDRTRTRLEGILRDPFEEGTDREAALNRLA